MDAIRQGAQASGTSFDYLLATAQRESALVPTAKAQTSSATGLFQFVEQTWLGLMKSEGGKLGLDGYAAAISAQPNGALSVADPATKQAILKLREDPVLSATLAGTLAQKNGASLAPEIGRSASGADLYVAHFLGARGAAELIKSAQATPTRPAALDFPEAAAANRRIFYEPTGRPRGAAEVYNMLAAGQSAAPATSLSVAAPPIGMTRAANASSATRQTGPAMYGLFQTDARSGPVSDAVARVWRTNATNTGAATQTAASFFPRETTVASLAEPPPSEPTPVIAAAALNTRPGSEAVSAPQAAINVPLPPSRPRAGTVQVQSAAGRSPSGAPLDLLSYMKPPRS